MIRYQALKESKSLMIELWLWRPFRQVHGWFFFTSEIAGQIDLHDVRPWAWVASAGHEQCHWQRVSRCLVAGRSLRVWALKPGCMGLNPRASVSAPIQGFDGSAYQRTVLRLMHSKQWGLKATLYN